MWTKEWGIGKMKSKYIFLCGLLVASGIVVGLTGAVLKYAVLEPHGFTPRDSAVALPFVYLRDDGLQYVVLDLQETKPVEETIPPVIQPPKVDLTLPERMLFIGDSRTCGLRDHARADQADYFCDVGMSLFNVGSKQLSDVDFKNESLCSLLSEREYGYVVISLGLNEAGYPVESILKAYQELLTQVVRTQPQAVIVLQGVMGVTRQWAQKADYTAPEHLAVINSGIQTLAGWFRVHYLEPNDWLAEDDDYLPEVMTADGCHLYPEYYSLWSRWIVDQVKKI